MFKSLCLYHGNCPDGGFAALACKLALGNTVLMEPHYTTTPFDLDACLVVNPYIQTVYLLDYCGPIGFLKKCDGHPQLHKVYLIDHHKTAFEEVYSYRQKLSGKVTLLLDTDMSACVMALSFFMPKKVTPSLKACFDYVQDNDLWKFELPESKEFSAGLRSLNIDWSIIDIGLLTNLDSSRLIESGKAALEKEELQIIEASKHSFKIKLDGIPYTATECLHYEIISELGHRLSSDTGYAAIYRIMDDNTDSNKNNKDNNNKDNNNNNTTNTKVKLSLRSDSQENDTTVFSKSRKGGGHACASGCVITLDEWNSFPRI